MLIFDISSAGALASTGTLASAGTLGLAGALAFGETWSLSDPFICSFSNDSLLTHWGDGFISIVGLLPWKIWLFEALSFGLGFLPSWTEGIAYSKLGYHLWSFMGGQKYCTRWKSTFQFFYFLFYSSLFYFFLAF